MIFKSFSYFAVLDQLSVLQIYITHVIRKEKKNHKEVNIQASRKHEENQHCVLRLKRKKMQIELIRTSILFCSHHPWAWVVGRDRDVLRASKISNHIGLGRSDPSNGTCLRLSADLSPWKLHWDKRFLSGPSDAIIQFCFKASRL